MKTELNGVNGHRVLTTSSGDLFNGFFTHPRTYHSANLIDARARRVFEMTARACEADAYPYQLPLQGRSGPMVQAEGRELMMLSSYDYLGLIGDPRVDEAAISAIRKYGTGTGGVRMLTGTIDLHREMEKDLAAFKGTAEAISFSSGYLANLAVMSALLVPQDRVILDTLSHRSLVDACRLTGVQVQRFRHNDPQSLRKELETPSDANRTLIVADGVFSMDGDICCLPELIALKKEFNCFLMVDEAHATGVLGIHGRGTTMNTLGLLPRKWISGPARSPREFLQTGGLQPSPRNSPFIYSMPLRLSSSLRLFALPPLHLCALVSPFLLSEPERVARLKANTEFLLEGLKYLGYDTGASETAVIPVILGDEAKAAFCARRLRDFGIIVTPVMFPAVAQGSARLRLCVTAAHSTEQLGFALDAFRKLRQ